MGFWKLVWSISVPKGVGVPKPSLSDRNRHEASEYGDPGGKSCLTLALWSAFGILGLENA